MSVFAAAVHEGVDVHGQTIRVLVDDEIQPELLAVGPNLIISL